MENQRVSNVINSFFTQLLITIGKKSSKKIWSVSKTAVILHRFSPQTGCESNSKKSSLTCLQRYNVVQEKGKYNVPVDSKT